MIVVVTEPSGLVEEVSDLTVVEDELLELLPPLPDAPPAYADLPDAEVGDEDDAWDEDVSVCDCVGC